MALPSSVTGPGPCANSFLRYSLPELQPFWVTELLVGWGRGGGGTLSSLSFTLSPQAAGTPVDPPLACCALSFCPDLCAPRRADASSIYAPNAVLNTSRAFTYLILTSTLWSRHCFYRRFTSTVDKTGAQRDQIACKLSHGSGIA